MNRFFVRSDRLPEAPDTIISVRAPFVCIGRVGEVSIGTSFRISVYAPGPMLPVFF